MTFDPLQSGLIHTESPALRFQSSQPVLLYLVALILHSHLEIILMFRLLLR